MGTELQTTANLTPNPLSDSERGQGGEVRDVISEILADGYTVANRSWPHIVIDIDCAAERQCEGCGLVGMLLVPLQRGDSYRAVLRCNQCGFEEEF